MNPRFSKVKRFAGFPLGACIVLAALVMLRRHTENITFPMVASAMEAAPAWRIILSMTATFVSFAAMAANEVIAVHALPDKKLPWRIPVLAGAAGNALSNTLGFPALTISAWRYKVYSASGLNLPDIARITAVAFMGVMLGFAGMAAFSLSLAPLGGQAARMAGLFLLFLIIGFLAWVSPTPRQIGFKGWSIALPGARLGAWQLIIGFIDMSAAVYAAYILLPADIAPGFAHFAVFYIGAALFGIASHAPGGIGVFEASIMTALASDGRADVLAALLLHRVIYNLLPFCFACVAVAVQVLRGRPQLDNG